MKRFIQLCQTGISLYPIRLLMFGVFSVFVFGILFLWTLNSTPAFMSAENGPLESLQVVFALAASVMFFNAAVRCQRCQAGFVLMGVLTGYAVARELDTVFEWLFFDDAYKVLVGVPLTLLLVVTCWRNRATLVGDGVWMSFRPPATFFAIGSLYLICVCQVIDSPAFWGKDMVLSEALPAKQMIEEFCEVFAYLLLAYAGVEGLALAFLDRGAHATSPWNACLSAVAGDMTDAFGGRKTA